MNTYAVKTQENKSQSVAHSVSQKQSGNRATFQFVDNRPESITQRKQQKMIGKNPQVMSPNHTKSKESYVRKMQKGVVQREYDLADNSEENKEKMRLYDIVLHEVHDILSAKNVAYKLQGSMAQAMQGGGVLELPGDIDVLVPSPIIAANFLAASGKFTITVRSGIVSKVNHKDTGIQVDLAETDDFGMAAAGTEEIEGIAVLNLYETLTGLLLRPEKRLKDHVAFISLIVPRGDELSDEEKEALVGRTPFKSWSELYGFALENYTKMVME